MAHFAVLRHNFDIHHDPDRLGPGHDDETFWLGLGSGGEAPNALAGNVVWLVSWEGFMKTHHVLRGWFKVEQIGRRAGVVAQHYISGNEGAIFPKGVGPLDMTEWFHQFVEGHRKFREGEPTEIDEYVGEMLKMVHAAGCRAPSDAPSGQVPV